MMNSICTSKSSFNSHSSNSSSQANFIEAEFAKSTYSNNSDSGCGPVYAPDGYSTYHHSEHSTSRQEVYDVNEFDALDEQDLFRRQFAECMRNQNRDVEESSSLEEFTDGDFSWEDESENSETEFEIDEEELDWELYGSWLQHCDDFTQEHCCDNKGVLRDPLIPGFWNVKTQFGQSRKHEKSLHNKAVAKMKQINRILFLALQFRGGGRIKSNTRVKKPARFLFRFRRKAASSICQEPDCKKRRAAKRRKDKAFIKTPKCASLITQTTQVAKSYIAGGRTGSTLASQSVCKDMEKACKFEALPEFPLSVSEIRVHNICQNLDSSCQNLDSSCHNVAQVESDLKVEVTATDCSGLRNTILQHSDEVKQTITQQKRQQFKPGVHWYKRYVEVADQFRQKVQQAPIQTSRSINDRQNFCCWKAYLHDRQLRMDKGTEEQENFLPAMQGNFAGRLTPFQNLFPKNCIFKTLSDPGPRFSPYHNPDWDSALPRLNFQYRVGESTVDLSAIVDGLPDDLNSGLTKKEKKTVLKSERRAAKLSAASPEFWFQRKVQHGSARSSVQAHSITSQKRVEFKEEFKDQSFAKSSRIDLNFDWDTSNLSFAQKAETLKEKLVEMVKNDGYEPPPPVEWLVEAMKGEWSFGRDSDYWAYVINQIPRKAEDREIVAGDGRDIGHAGMTLQCFENLPVAKSAGLSLAEIIALRLYTGPAYTPINYAERRKLSTYSVTTYCIESAIIKLGLRATQNWDRNSEDCAESMDVFRGIKGNMPSEFVQAYYGAHGLGESDARAMADPAFISATNNKEIALGDKYGGEVLFVFHCQAPSFNELTGEGILKGGADVSWISQFPREQEVLFPRFTELCYVEPSERYKGWSADMKKSVAHKEVFEFNIQYSFNAKYVCPHFPGLASL